MSGDHRPLTQAVLGVAAARMRIKSASELFNTVASAQPAQTKRRKASDQQMDELTDDLRGDVPELSDDQITALRAAEPRPSPAQLEALRVPRTATVERRLADNRGRDHFAASRLCPKWPT